MKDNDYLNKVLYIIFLVLVIYVFTSKITIMLDYNYICLSTLIGMVTIFIFIKVLKIRDNLLIGFSGIKPIFLEIRPTLFLVTGVSGSGKTRFTQRIIKKLGKKNSVYVFDWYNEYHVLNFPRHEITLSEIGFPIKTEIELIETRDILSAALNLTDGQTNILSRALKALNSKGLTKINIPEIKEMVEQLAIDYENRAETIAWQILLRKFEGLVMGKRCSVSFTNPGIFVIAGGDVEKKIGYALVLRRLLQEFSKEGILKKVCRVIVIEEAHNLIPEERRNLMFEKWILEMQKYGVMVIMIAPSTSLLSKTVKIRTPIWISFAIAPSDASIVDLKLKRGEAVIREGGEAVKFRPLLFKIRNRQLETKGKHSITAIIRCKLMKNKTKRRYVSEKGTYMIIIDNDSVYSSRGSVNTFSKNIYRIYNEWIINRIDSNNVEVLGPNVDTRLPLAIESVAKLEEIKAPDKVIDEFLTILAEKDN